MSFDDDLEELLVLDPRIPSLIEVHLRVLEPVEEAIQRANFSRITSSSRGVTFTCRALMETSMNLRGSVVQPTVHLPFTWRPTNAAERVTTEP